MGYARSTAGKWLVEGPVRNQGRPTRRQRLAPSARPTIIDPVRRNPEDADDVSLRGAVSPPIWPRHHEIAHPFTRCFTKRGLVNVSPRYSWPVTAPHRDAARALPIAVDRPATWLDEAPGRSRPAHNTRTSHDGPGGTTQMNVQRIFHRAQIFHCVAGQALRGTPVITAGVK